MQHLTLSFAAQPCSAILTVSRNAATVLEPFTRSLPTATFSSQITAAATTTAARRRASSLSTAAADVDAATSGSFQNAPQIPVTEPIPAVSGVYAVYDPQGALQFVGISRKVAVSVATHVDALPELVGSVKVLEMPNAGKDELTEAWKEWIQQAVDALGGIPPGNAPGEKKWQQRRARAAKPEIRLTPGKGIEDLTCTVEELVDQVVKGSRCVVFLKGTRTEPACGFSHKALTILTEVAGSDFEVVNVLDEIYNPGVRDAVKQYTQWPTIPQVFVGGEFVGGSDILEQMHGNGELRQMLEDAKK